MTTLKRTLYTVGFLLILALTVPVSADVWVVGRIFVSEADGSIHVYDNSGNVVDFSCAPTPCTPTVPEILTVSGSALGGADFEDIYHLNATDLNSATTGFGAFRFPIPDPHTPPTVDFNTAGFSPGMAKQASSIRHDGLGHLFVGFLVNSPNFNLAEYSLGVSGPPSSDPPTAKFITTFPPESGETKGALGVAYMDLKASGTEIVYTSRSNCVHVFNVSTTLQESDFIPCVSKLTVNGTTVFGSKSAFDGVQLLSDGGLLVGVNGGGGNVSNNYVVRFNSSGSPTQAFTASATGPDVSIVLDPLCATCFWAGSGTSLSKFDMSTCTTATSPCAPLSGFPKTTAANIVNLAAFGTTSPAQPKPNDLFSVTVTPGSPTGTLASSSTGNTITFTVNFTTGTTLTLNARDTTIVPAAGANDLGDPCTKTVLVGITPTNCLVWKFDPSTFTGWDSIDLRYDSLGQSPNSREFLDETTDETTGVVGPTWSRTGSSVHSLNEVGGTNEGCSYESPVDNPPLIAYLNNPGNVAVKFQCTTLGTNISELNPTLTILQISGNGTGTGALVFPPPGQTGGTTPNYRLGSNSWIVNVDTSNFTGCFLATTFDNNHIASSFFAVFGVNVPTGSCTIP